MSQPSSPGDLDVLVVGAGAIGALYGGWLSQAGARVSVVCRSNYPSVTKKGFEIQSCLGNFHFAPVQVYKNIPSEKFDIVVVATKAMPDTLAIADLKRCMADHTAIVLLQNGIRVEDTYINEFPSHELISGLCFVCVNKGKANSSEDNQIRHIDYGRITLGRYPSGRSERVESLVSLFRAVGVIAKESLDIHADRWKKLIWNAPFNPISVLAGGLNTAQILKDPDLKALVRTVMEEVISVAKADGSKLSPSLIDQNIENTLKMTPYKTSMLLDHENGRPLETDAILGAMMRLADRYNVSVPASRSLYGLLKGVALSTS